MISFSWRISIIIRFCKTSEAMPKTITKRWCRHKKVVLNLFESMAEAKLITRKHIESYKKQQAERKREVVFNYRINSDKGLVKSITKYSSEDYLIDCFQNITVESTGKVKLFIQKIFSCFRFNSLKHPSKLPVVSILSAKVKNRSPKILTQ